MKSTVLGPSVVDIGLVQSMRKGSLALLIAVTSVVCIFSASRWPTSVHQAIEWVGMGLILICISGRTWCSLYIGGRKTSELVTSGPYSISRNPLYVFSIIGAVGAGAQLGAVTIAIVGGVAAWIVHMLVVIQEERLLLAEHGDVYRQYMADVPRFLPRISRWKDVDVLEVQPHAVARTYLDACFFLVTIPLSEGIEFLQNAGLIHVFIRLP